MKRLFLSVFALMLVISASLAPSVYAGFSDVEDEYEYKEAINELTQLHIVDGYEDNTFRPLGGITRAEFTKMLICAMGFNGNTMINTFFTDVSGHWSESYVTAAAGLNVVSGFEDGTFRPNDPVTYEQCLTMLDRALGYESEAANRGGYPDGYISAGISIGLTARVSSFEYSQPASRGMVAQLIYNSLEIPILGSTRTPDDDEEEDGTPPTLLNSYLKVKKLSGIVVGVEEYVTNECSVNLYPGQMDILSRNTEYIIDFSQYTQNVTEINKYLGHTVSIYYKESTFSDDAVLISIDGETAANTMTEIFYRDIHSYSANTLKYYDVSSGSLKSFKINPNTATIRYNGRIVSENEVITLKDGSNATLNDALKEWFNPGSENCIYGDVTLSSSSDGQVKLVQINDYKTIVALRTPSTTDYKIMDKLVTGNSLTLDPSSPDYTYTITKNGAQIPVTSVAANDVILYAESLDGELYTAIATAKTVTGMISSVEDNGDTLVINGSKYSVGKYCEDYISSNQSGQNLRAGVSGTFYLDKYDTITFAVITEETAAPYAYITNAYIAQGTDSCYVTVFESAKDKLSAKSYLLKDKVRFNGSNLDAEKVISRLAQTSEYSNADADFASDIYGRGQKPTLSPKGQYEVYSQIARVGFDGDRISSIVTLNSELEGSANENKQQIVRHRGLGNYQYRSNSFSANGTNNVITTNSSTVVICVPQDRTNKTGYAQKTVSGAFTSGESYYVEAYDVNSSRVAGLIILYSGENASLTRVTRASNFAVVSGYPETVEGGSSGSYSLRFPMYWGPENSSPSTEKQWTTFDDTEFGDVEIGDVIQFAYNSDKEIQGRINNIRFSDIEQILDGQLNSDGVLYDWTERVNEDTDPNHQEYKFDYRFRTQLSSGGYMDEMYSSPTLGNVPYARACMYNVMQVIPDNNQIYVTKHGFDENGKLIDDNDYEVVDITSSTKFIKMNDSRDSLSPYAEDAATALSINDLLDSQYYGSECSKILVCSQQGAAKLIVIYK